MIARPDFLFVDGPDELLLRPVSQRAHAWAADHLGQFPMDSVRWRRIPQGDSPAAIENIHAAGYTVAPL